MGWEDRDYNTGGGSGGEYLGNPAMFFAFSLPFGRWFGIPVRLSIWLLISLVFMLFSDMHAGTPTLFVVQAPLLIGFLLAHDFAHRIFAERVGGSLDEFLLWPAGGMIHPTAPPAPWPTFFAHVGGIVANLLLGAACVAGIYAVSSHSPFSSVSWDPMSGQFGEIPMTAHPYGAFTLYVLILALQFNLGIILVNLLPFYWYDGGFLLESILWPWLERAEAINVTCIIGMCIAGPMFLVSIYFINPFGMIYWALLFASSYNKRRTEAAYGAGQESYAFSAAAYESTRRSSGGRKARWASRSAVKKAAAARKEQENIDAILEKVHAQGMQSLNWMERRALRKATERQRERQI